MTFEVVKSIHDPALLQVVEDGKYRMFEGNSYQCSLYIQARKDGWDTVTACHGAKMRTCRPYKTIRIYLD